MKCTRYRLQYVELARFQRGERISKAPETGAEKNRIQNRLDWFDINGFFREKNGGIRSSVGTCIDPLHTVRLTAHLVSAHITLQRKMLDADDLHIS